MFNTIEEYLDALKNEMKDADLALIQDAQADAREHLSSAMVVAHEFTPQMSDIDALKKIIEEYGTPQETAFAYQEVERRMSNLLKRSIKPRSALSSFFGVYTDRHAWGALLYMLIAFITGIFYFVWVVIGVPLSVSLMILIIGFPIAILFLLSVRGLALIEGRLVEALLGIRMPRRPLFSHPDMKLLDRLKALLSDRATWLMLVYMIIQFVLGIFYFVLIILMLGVSLSFILIPFGMVSLDFSGEMVMNNNDLRDIFAPWSYPLLILIGVLIWTSFMHIVRGVGQLHGRMAKWMLVS